MVQISILNKQQRHDDISEASNFYFEAAWQEPSQVTGFLRPFSAFTWHRYVTGFDQVQRRIVYPWSRRHRRSTGAQFISMHLNGASIVPGSVSDSRSGMALCGPIASVCSRENSKMDSLVPALRDVQLSVDNIVREVGDRFCAEVMHVPSCIFADKYGIELARDASPTLVVDLSRVARNVNNIRRMFGGECPTLRYAVKCNDDEAIVSLLNKLDFHFEVSSVSDADLLHRLGVMRERILLVDTAFSVSGVQALDNIGIVSIFEPPAMEVVENLKGSDVKFEIRVPQGALSELHVILERMQSMSDRITSIAFEKDPNSVMVCSETGNCNTFGRFKLLDQVCDNFSRTGTREIHVNAGEMWEVDAAGGLQSLKETAAQFIPDSFDLKNVSVDVSRLVVGNSVSLVTTVIGRRIRRKSMTASDSEVEEVYSYYLDDGVYGAFSFVQNEECGNTAVHTPFIYRATGADYHDTISINVVDAGSEAEEMRTEFSVLYGPTCDATDRIWEGRLPVLNVGDRLVFPNMGAYASSAATSFNGFGIYFDTRYVMSAMCCGD